jgi:hypothetical protein
MLWVRPCWPNTDPTLCAACCQLCLQDAAAYAERRQLAKPNVVIRVLWVRDWPFPFMLTSRAVKKGEDLWYDYGQA